MPAETKTRPMLAAHGGSRLPAVDIDSYNIEIKDDGGFIGDRASKRAFQNIFDSMRKALGKLGSDPFGDMPTGEISKKRIDAALTGGDTNAAALIQGAIEEYAQSFAGVIRRYTKAKEWRDTERVVVGGGMRASRFGELAIARTEAILKVDGLPIDLVPIHNDPDDAGLIGAAHLAPSWIFTAHDALLAVDIGGTNIRCGVVGLNLKKAPDFSQAFVWKREHWRHADDKPKRDEAIESLVAMLNRLLGAAEKQGFKLAPFIGVGCPGIIDSDGSIERGAQNLPGNWASSRFNLPGALFEAIPAIGGHETTVMMHNDAVVQGLSEVPFCRDVARWGVLTIGTGLGNARFTNRTAPEKD